LELLGAAGLILGDADGDGSVGFSDFLLLSDRFGQPGTYQEGNFDLIGTVDFNDFLILTNNYGRVAGAPFSVPEPSCLSCAVMGLVILLARFRPGRG
jgi:hypothetical protein